VRSYEGQALVDTGAMDNITPPAVLRQLGLTAMERTPVRYADGRREVVDKIGPMMIYVLDRRANGSAFVLGDGILIGRLALASMDLHVDCMNQRVIPNPLHPDGPVFRI
jgi:clan AA aspartic protease